MIYIYIYIHTTHRPASLYMDIPRGRMYDFSFFGCLSPFCSLLIELHCTFFVFLIKYHIMVMVILSKLLYFD